jgi:hypothetical protein
LAAIQRVPAKLPVTKTKNNALLELSETFS